MISGVIVRDLLESGYLPVTGSPEFPSLHAWDAWVAIATIALAFATGALAFFTWRLARAARAESSELVEEVKAVKEQAQSMAFLVQETQKQVAASNAQVDLADRTLLASVRPLLVDVPLATFWVGEGIERRDRGVIRLEPSQDAAGWLMLSVPVRNVGAGPALIESLKAELPAGIVVDQVIGRMLHSAVPTGELSRMQFEIQTKLDVQGALAIATGHDSSVYVSVEYRDMARAQRLRSRLEIFGSPAAGFRAFATELYEDDPDTPFATSRRSSLE